MTWLAILAAAWLVYRLRRIVIVLLILVLVAACAREPIDATASPPPPKRIVVEQQAFTEAQLTCADEPAPPPGPVKNRMLGPYIAGLAEAGDDCRQQLASARSRLKGDAP